jgi:nucleotide-binding universal stress UspA family protein
VIEPTSSTELAAEAATVFTHVLVGVDQSPASIDAVRQAARLAQPEGTLTFLAAWAIPRRTLEPAGTTTMLAATTGPPVTYGVLGPGPADDEAADIRRRAAEHAVGLASAEVAASATKIAEGVAWEELVAESTREHSTLVAVGSHGHGRIPGLLRGSTMTEVVHKSPCSVLVARPAGDEFPQRILVHVDGSPASRFAQEVGRQVATRFGSEFRQFAAVEPLLAASADADLVVVGSHGLHGLRALASVSERVAHTARCSTLIVRLRTA